MKNILSKIILLVFVLHLFSLAGDAVQQKKRTNWKKNSDKSYSEKRISVPKNQKKSVSKTQQRNATPKIDALIHTASSQVQQIENRVKEEPRTAAVQNKYFILAVSFIMAGCITAAGLYVIRNPKKLTIAVRKNPIVLKTEQTYAALSPPENAKPKFFLEVAAERNEDETFMLTERFHASQQHIELERSLNTDPKTAKFKLLKLPIKSSLKKQIAAAKKLNIGVGELVLHQRITLMERNTKKEKVL